MYRVDLIRMVQTPPLKGGLALGCAALAIGIPTAVRAAIIGAITGCEFTPYLPFVLIAAILLPWWGAAAVAVSAVVIMGGMLQGSHHYMMECFLIAAPIFLLSSAAMIGAAILVRWSIAALRRRGADGSDGGVVFSLEDGQVWASWYGQAAPVRLGSQRDVSIMMRDFLAQEELAKRLSVY